MEIRRSHMVKRAGRVWTGAADQERMRRIVASGHTIAMHSWSHDYNKVYASVEDFLGEFDQLYHWIYQCINIQM